MAYLKGIWKILSGFSFTNNSRQIISLFASAYIFAVGLSCLGYGASGLDNVKSVFGWLGLHDVVRWVSYRQEHTNGIVFTGLNSIVLFWFLVSCLYVYQSYSRSIGNLLPQSMIAFSLFSALLVDLKFVISGPIIFIALVVFCIFVVNSHGNKEDYWWLVYLLFPIIAFVLSFFYFIILPGVWFCDVNASSNDKGR